MELPADRICVCFSVFLHANALPSVPGNCFSPLEHKNMPLDDALGLVDRDYDRYRQNAREGRVPPRRAPPPGSPKDEVPRLLAKAASGEQLSRNQLSAVIGALQRQKESDHTGHSSSRLAEQGISVYCCKGLCADSLVSYYPSSCVHSLSICRQVVSTVCTACSPVPTSLSESSHHHSAADDIQRQQADLQAKILSLLGSNAVVPSSSSPSQPHQSSSYDGGRSVSYPQSGYGGYGAGGSERDERGGPSGYDSYGYGYR